MQRYKWLTLSIAFVGALAAIGCGGNGIKTIPVFGKVTVTGRPYPSAVQIFFLPVNVDGPKRPCFAEAEKDGNYAARAFKDSDGLIPGTYKINVIYSDLKPGANPALDSNWTQHTFDGGELVVDANA